MKIFNSLSNLIEEFKPSSSTVSFYMCGPTVYDYAHIGNLRAYIIGDLLRKALILNGYSVKQVMNITDIDDKIIKKSDGKKDKHAEIVKKYEDLFWQDMESIGVDKPNIVTRATEYIPQMVALVDDLLKKGYAYKAEDGSIYFSINKFSHYGKLSDLDKSGQKSGARVTQDNYSKENPADFALWKAWDKNDGEIYWEPADFLGSDTRLPKGRPGWHIECSAMSQAELGETIDIHAGGIDLKFPHHENEIAQSEASTGKKFARYWVHGEHLLVNNQKMSKSLNNFYKLLDIVDRGYDPLDFRYMCIAAHYRSKLNFTWEGLEAAKNSRNRLKRIAEDLRNKKQDTRHNKQSSDKSQISNSQYLKKFEDKICNDLNTPEALAVLWEMLRDNSVDDDSKLEMLLTIDENILGLDLGNTNIENISSEIYELANKRDQAKNDRDYHLADEIREKIKEKGYQIEDTEKGSKIIKI